MKNIFICLALFMTGITDAAAQDARALQTAFNAVSEKARPAVVSVQVVKEETQKYIEPDFYFGYMLPSERVYNYLSEGVGSGVVIAPEGYVLTNYHVVNGAARIKIVFQDLKGVEKTYMAVLHAADPAMDLALLKIQKGRNFPYLRLSEAPGFKVGDLVLAVGYPFGFKQTMTSGIISALNVSLKGEGRRYENLIQTDAAINQGNSGGPLLNLDGEIIGINTALASPTGAFAGMGFAVPGYEIKKVIGDLIAAREIKRGWLGVSLLPVDTVMAARLGYNLPSGAIVNSVISGSPAAAAGIKRGDIIATCNGDPIETNDDLFYKTYSGRPGEKIDLVYIRGGSRKTVTVELGERPQDGRGARPQSRRAGIEQPSSAKTYEWEGALLATGPDGAKVVSLNEDSGLAGYLRAGDIIRSVNSRDATGSGELSDIFSRAGLEEGVLLDILRDGESFYLSIQTR